MVRKTLLASAMAITLAGGLALPPAGASNDRDFSKQWNLQKIGAPAAWARTTGAHVRVGIVDAGVDLTHEDLAGRVVAQTSCLKSKGDATKCTGSGQDDVGHGTHVAGIIAATKDNGVGVAGVAPDAELVVAKVADSGGGIAIDDANAGIRWVVDHGAKVVNLSLGDLIFVRMAASHVTGAVALLLAQGLSPQAAVQRLLDTADPTVSCGADSPTCKGRLDVAKATGG